MKITEEEFKKIGNACDINECFKLKCPYNSPDNDRWNAYQGKWGIQRMMDKFRKIYGYKIVEQKWHPEDKSFDVEIMINAQVTRMRHFSYEEICKTLWWHSFEIVSEYIILPKPFTFEERAAILCPNGEAYWTHEDWVKHYEKEANAKTPEE